LASREQFLPSHLAFGTWPRAIVDCRQECEEGRVTAGVEKRSLTRRNGGNHGSPRTGSRASPPEMKETVPLATLSDHDVQRGA